MSSGSKTLTKLLMLTLLTSVACFADVVVGTFFVSGTATVGTTSISFSPTTVTFVSGSDPSLPTLGSTVTIGTLDSLTAPVGESFPTFTDWLMDGDTALDLTALPVGINTPAPIGTPPCQIGGGAVGDTCTPEIPALVSPGNPLGLSNFNLQNVANGFTASFVVNGMARDLDGGTNNVDSFTGSFAATLPGTYQNELANISMNGPQAFPFTGQFTMSLVPEPSFLPLFGIGGILMIGIALYRRRFQQI